MTETAVPPVADVGGSQPHRRRVFIVDDHEILRCGFRHLLSAEDDLEICGEAGSVDEALARVDELRPDVVVADLAMPGRNGLDLVKSLSVSHPDLPVLVVSMYDEHLYGERVLRAGARGYITKDAASEQLVKALRKVLDGKPYISATLSEMYLEDLLGGRTGQLPVARLSDREIEVFEALGQGHHQRQIAEDLGVKPRTIEAHCAKMRKKLGLRDSRELFRFAVRYFESGKGAGK